MQSYLHGTFKTLNVAMIPVDEWLYWGSHIIDRSPMSLETCSSVIRQGSCMFVTTIATNVSTMTDTPLFVECPERFCPLPHRLVIQCGNTCVGYPIFPIMYGFCCCTVTDNDKWIMPHACIGPCIGPCLLSCKVACIVAVLFYFERWK